MADLRRAVVTLVLLLCAGAAVPPARAQRGEGRGERRDERREAPREPRKSAKHAPAAKPKRKAQPHRRSAPGARRRPRSGQEARKPPRGDREDRSRSSRGREAREQRRRLEKPRPIADSKRFPRRWTPPPAPKSREGGGPLTATPSPSPRHTEIFNNSRVVTTIISNQQNETAPGRYYWHHDGGFDYVHCYRGGVHWYGFYVGPHYYWSQYRANRWWWFDPVARRYLYFSGGYWWWQNPVNPAALYVYQSDGYVSYETAVAEAEAQPAAAAAPSRAAPPVPAPAATPYHSDVDAPNYALEPNASRLALVVGVEDYAGLPGAEFAGRDAEAVRAHLAALGWPDRNIVSLTGAQATRVAVAKAVESWLTGRAAASSRVFVYFAGDGAVDPGTGVEYLLPSDGDAGNLASTGYSLKQLYAALNALPAKEIVVALDAGFSGAGGRSARAAGARPAANVDDGRAFAGKLVIFSAAGSGEAAGTAPEQGHGLFTYWFLKGLNGGAPQTQDGVTVQGLFDYLAPNVEDAARRDGRDQTPLLLVPPDGQRGDLIKDLR